MRIDHYIHYVSDDHTHKLLHEILNKQNSTLQKLTKMANEIQELTTEVEETKGIMASAMTLIRGFAAALAAAGTDPVALTNLKNSLNAGSEELAAAIAENPLPGEVVTPPTE